MAIYRAISGLATVRKGQRVRVHPGDTVEEGHWLLDLSPDAFRPLDITFPAENAKGDDDSQPTRSQPRRRRSS